MPKRNLDLKEQENVIEKKLNIEMSSNINSELVTQTGPLFDPGMGESLIQILNQLDRVSFVKFAKTCNYLYNFCLYTKGIHVPFRLREILVVKEYNNSGVDLRMRKYIHGAKTERLTEKQLRGLMKMPFVLEIERLSFLRSIFCTKINSRDLERFHQFLRCFFRITIGDIIPYRFVDWHAFAGIVQEFGVNWLHVYPDDPLERIPATVLPIFLNKAVNFHYELYIPDDLILSATSKNLWLHRARISTETFKKLVKKFVVGEICESCFGREPLINGGNHSDPFFEACSEVMPVVRVDNHYVEIKEAGVMYFTDPRHVRLLKSDKSIGRFYINYDIIWFY